MKNNHLNLNTIQTIYDFGNFTKSQIKILNLYLWVTKYKNEFEKIRVYPSPSKDIFNILFENFSDQHLSISIYDILGKLIYYKNYNNVNSDFKASINLENYLGSLYLLEIKTRDQIIKKKLIKE